jgi:L,D-transpeptidase-like protein
MNTPPRRILLGTALSICLFSTTAASAATEQVRLTQPLVLLLDAHSVHRDSNGASPLTTQLAAQRPITGEPTTLPVIARRNGPEGTLWLDVMLPGRPNGSSGWISGAGTRELQTSWSLTVDLGRRLVRAYLHGRVLRSFPAVVGKPSTPTPTGQFFVEETLQMAPGEVGGPFALALSARSDALQSFEGGPGQIAIHGRGGGLGGTLGQAESHGCVRLETSSIEWLAARIGPGTPVIIYR